MPHRKVRGKVQKLIDRATVNWWHLRLFHELLSAELRSEPRGTQSGKVEGGILISVCDSMILW